MNIFEMELVSKTHSTTTRMKLISRVTFFFGVNTYSQQIYAYLGTCFEHYADTKSRFQNGKNVTLWALRALNILAASN